MKAMILAAGLGTRLRPLTDNTPKALVKLKGRPVLEWLILRLRNYSFREIIINAHHFADQIESFIKEKNNFGIRIEISHENELLNTGGGLKKAAWFFDDGQPFLLHNVDVLTDLDYGRLLSFHKQQKTLATLAVRSRRTARYLLFNQDNELCGWESRETGQRKLARPVGKQFSALSFMGIHIISPKIFKFMQLQGKFSIIEAYLDLAARDKMVKAFRADEYRWLDLGKKENLQQAAVKFQDIIA